MCVEKREGVNEIPIHRNFECFNFSKIKQIIKKEKKKEKKSHKVGSQLMNG